MDRFVNRYLRQAQQRALRHWYEDGLSEMAVGGFFFVLGLLFLAAERTDALGRVAQALWPLYVLCGVWLLNRIIRRGKEAVAYPRSGYVRFSRPGARRRWTFVTMVVVAAAVALYLILSGQTPASWLTSLLQSLIFLGVFGYLAVRLGLWRFYLVALAGGLWPWLVNRLVSAQVRDALVYGGIGGLLLLSGLWAFWRFLQQPVLDMEEEQNHA